jgi:hypothetical protein
VVCKLGSLSSGDTARITILATSHGVGKITNIASAGANEPDPNMSNNTALATTTIHQGPPPTRNPRYCPSYFSEPPPTPAGAEATRELLLARWSPDYLCTPI